jgi:hypothetical protein
MEHDNRQEGKLVFEKQGLRKEWPILWELESGIIADGQTWRAAVSFSRDWKCPSEVMRWVFEYLSGDEVSIYLSIDGIRYVKCSALFEPDDLEDFSMWGTIPLGSPNHNRIYIRYNR